MLRRTAGLVLAGAAPSVAGAQQRATAPTALVFDGVAVVDVEQGKLVPDQRVVITGNRIQAMGSTSALQAPDGAQVVDAHGKYLIPGLWDMHVHLGQEDKAPLFYSIFIANGVTGFRDAWTYVPLDTLVRWREEILAGTRVGPPRQLLTGSPLYDNDAVDSAQAREKVDSLKAHGANFLKVYPFTFIGAWAARRAGLPFGGHVGGMQAALRVPGEPVQNPQPVDTISAVEASDNGISIMDHTMTSGGLDTLCLGSRAVSPASLERCRPVAARLRQNNTWWVPTLIYRISIGNPDHPTNPGAAANIARDRLGKSEKFLNDSGPLPESHWLHDAVSGGKIDSLRFLSIAERAGLPILSGTDVQYAGWAGFSLHAELAIYAAEGLTPLEALQTATLNPAKLLHGTDSLGTVAPGKLADLVLLDGNPLEDITNTTAIRAVVANGRYFDRAALDSLLAEARAKAKQHP